MVAETSVSVPGAVRAAKGTTTMSSGPAVRRTPSVQVIWVTFAAAALPLTSIATGPILARALGPSGRGELAALLTPIAVASYVASLGLPDAATYLVAGRRQHARRVVAAALTLVVPAAIVAISVLWVVAPWLLDSYPQGVKILRIGALALVPMIALDVARGALFGEGRFGAVNFEQLVYSTARLALVAIMAAAGALTVVRALAIHVGAGLAAGVIVIVAVTAGRAGKERAEPTPALVGDMARFGLRGWGGTVATTINVRLDQALLVTLVGSAQLGYYAVAVAVAELPRLLFEAIRTVLLPEAAARKDPLVVARAARVAVLLSSSMAAVGVVTAPLVIRLAFGDEFAPATPLVRVLFVASVPLATTFVIGVGLTALGRPGRHSLANVVSVPVTVGGLILLVPRFGTLGAALTSFLAYTTALVVSTMFFTRVCHLGVARVLVPRVDDVAWLIAQLPVALRGLRERPSRRQRRNRAGEDTEEAGPQPETHQ